MIGLNNVTCVGCMMTGLREQVEVNRRVENEGVVNTLRLVVNWGLIGHDEVQQNTFVVNKNKNWDYNESGKEGKKGMVEYECICNC